MKMRFPNSLQRNRRVARAAWPPILAVLVLVFAFSTLDVPGALRSGALYVAGPFWTARAWVASQVAHTPLGTVEERVLVEENAALREQVQVLRREVFGLRNASFSALRAPVATGTPVAELPASVLASTNLSPFDVFVVDRGSARGVREGALVVSPAGDAVGYVYHVATERATVRMFSSPGSAVQVLVHTASTSAQIEAEGKGEGTLELLVPRDWEVHVDDTLYLPGRLSLPLAEVVHIQSEPEAAHKVVLASLYTNGTDLTTVVVLPTVVWRADNGEAARIYDELFENNELE